MCSYVTAHMYTVRVSATDLNLGSVIWNSVVVVQGLASLIYHPSPRHADLE